MDSVKGRPFIPNTPVIMLVAFESLLKEVVKSRCYSTSRCYHRQKTKPKPVELEGSC